MRKAEERGQARPKKQGGGVPAFFSLGFRPFFLGASLFGVIAIGLWVMGLRTTPVISPGYGMATWHMHEMLFGYGPAVLSGFLLTAVPNWTGRQPMAGLALALLWLLWLAGRVAMMSEAALGVVIIVDFAFLPVVAFVIAREIIIVRNWRNLMVLGPIAVFALANGVFHFEVARLGTSDYGVRLGLAALVFLLMLIGGRIVPAFTRNWLVQRRLDQRPVGFARFDGIVLLISIAALVLWVVVPESYVTAIGLGLIAVLHGVRLMRWAGMATMSDPLLFVLHGAYAMIPAGLALLGLGAGTGDTAIQIAALHMLGIGAVGGMTLAVMIRASLGHTGRPLKADWWLGAGMGFVFVAAGLRVLGEFVAGHTIWIDLSAGFWIAGFSLFVLRIGPSLLKSRPGQGQT